MPKLYLIDGMSLVFRAYHAMTQSNFKTPSGEPSGAVFGFTSLITALVEKEKPKNIAVVFDRSEPTFRHIKYPLYKANRAEFPEELVPQLARIKELLNYLSIPQVELAGYEADDIIATLARQAAENGMEVRCLTSDKDFYQLVTDKVKLIKPQSKTSELVTIDIDGVKEKFGVKPEQVIDVLALIGDTADNVPGVKGIGEKTAIPLIQKYGSVENLYEHLGEIASNSVRTKLENDKEAAFLAKWLVTIMQDVPISEKPEELVWSQPKFRELDEFFAKEGFTQLRKRWKEKSADLIIDKAYEEDKDIISFSTEEEQVSGIRHLNDVLHEYIFVNSQQLFFKMLDDLRYSEIIAFDLETDSLDRMLCNIVGISLCAKEGKAYYIPVKGTDEDFTPIVNIPDEQGQASLFNPASKETKSNEIFINRVESPDFLPIKWVIDKLKPILQSPRIGKCGQNSKFDTIILRRHGIEVSPIVFDTMVASYLLNPDEKHNLDALSLKYLNYEPIPISSLIGDKKGQQITMAEIEPSKISDYAAEDADLALKLRNRIYLDLDKEGILKLAEELEFPLIEVLTTMEYNGVAIDFVMLNELSIMITQEAKELTKRIYNEAGQEFNIDSPQQLGTILFDKMKLPGGRKGKTGFSTDVGVLSELERAYPIAKMVLDYRQLVKLKNTYIDSLPKLINPRTGRIHTTYNQAVTSTGRLSSTDPNLQNIPIRTDLGKEVRKAFVPQSKEAVILSADYSQIELRIMAYICGDSQMIKGFKEGMDVHASTASLLFNVPVDGVISDQRRVAKTVNFGIMYGLGSYGLSQRLGLSMEDSKNIIDNYFRKFPGIKRYIDETIEKARVTGYAETLLGRKRYFADINNKNQNFRKAAERAAINMPIQGTASDMMKIAMINIHKAMKKQNMRSLMMLQVHDELVFEAYNDELADLTLLVKDHMESALALGEVPVVADTGVGDNWFEAH